MAGCFPTYYSDNPTAVYSTVCLGEPPPHMAQIGRSGGCMLASDPATNAMYEFCNQEWYDRRRAEVAAKAAPAASTSCAAPGNNTMQPGDVACVGPELYRCDCSGGGCAVVSLGACPWLQ